MVINEWVPYGVVLVTFTIGIYKLYDTFNKKVAKAEEKAVKDIARAYERFDEYKAHIEKMIEDKFVQKNLCDVMHANSADNLSGLEERLNGRISSVEKIVQDNPSPGFSRFIIQEDNLFQYPDDAQKEFLKRIGEIKNEG